MDDARAAGKTPFFVGSTAGTTVRGALDDLEEVQAVVDECDEPVWHHVDGSWGGAALWSPALKATWLAGVEKADSMAVNPHKLMNAAAISRRGLCDESRDATALAAGTNGAQASYLFQPDKENGDLDTGDKTIQCGRKPDAFKLWLMWKAPATTACARAGALRGARGPRRRGHQAARGRRRRAGAGHGAPLVHERALPRRAQAPARRARRAAAAVERSPEDLAALAKAQPFVKSAMQRDGDALIGFQAYGEAQYGNGEINFFRMVVAQGDLFDDGLLDDHTLDTMVKHADAFEAH
ncbi:carboxy-lyase [Aureococcus anophagefferens]|uniref:Carboxy-lyase n=1 Tax=Aureococcus anophagefferens TaxID=44056 RepID=A0ABR1G0P1_AURAN